jgi:hypothetical protein
LSALRERERDREREAAKAVKYLVVVQFLPEERVTLDWLCLDDSKLCQSKIARE